MLCIHRVASSQSSGTSQGWFTVTNHLLHCALMYCWLFSCIFWAGHQRATINADVHSGV